MDEVMGPPISGSHRDSRRGTGAAEGWSTVCEIRQGYLHLQRSGFLPAVAGRRAGRVSHLRQHDQPAQEPPTLSGAFALLRVTLFLVAVAAYGATICANCHPKETAR